MTLQVVETSYFCSRTRCYMPMLFTLHTLIIMDTMFVRLPRFPFSVTIIILTDGTDMHVPWLYAPFFHLRECYSPVSFTEVDAVLRHGGFADSSGATQKEEGFSGLLGATPMDSCSLYSPSNICTDLLQCLCGEYMVCHEIWEMSTEGTWGEYKESCEAS